VTVRAFRDRLSLLVRAWASVRHALLWRVRRRLILSYIFIGFVPALLIVCFFLIAGLLLFFTIGAYMLDARALALVADVRALAETGAVELEAIADGDASRALAARIGTVAGRYPTVSAVVVPAAPCGQAQTAGGAAPVFPDSRADAAPAPGDGRTGVVSRAGDDADRLLAGPWSHADPPRAVPPWMPCAGLARLTTVERAGRVDAVARAVVPVAGAVPRLLVVDVPIGEAFARALDADAGIRMEGVIAVRDAGAEGPPTPVNFGFEGAPPGASGLQGIAIVDSIDWATGRTRNVTVLFGMNVSRVYGRLSAFAFTRVGDFTFGQLLLIGLGVVGGLFFIILTVAFVMGMALARSVTGAVHELFVGTARVQRGDFTHRISVASNDQLGELATSFNAMTASIDDLLKQKAEKERLEQELRIARGIQMSLLPQAPLRVRGVSLAGSCDPAREVGGDYYDYFAIDEHRLGLLIADVAGKGTFAALYMAELKGIVLSLSQAHHSPRQLLIEANRIVSRHLDSRSFITMTYGVIDLRARTFTHARAGHCPLIHLPAGPSMRVPRVLVPDGLVLGLQIDDGRTFERLLEESTVPLVPGDFFLLYTDGLSEAMNEDGDFFGDARLGEALVSHARAPFDEAGGRILADVRAFVGAAAQHDDMTLLMIEVSAQAVGDGEVAA
jgi:serine phosphatase RsbU (regulator of sigma subunit)